MKVWQHRSFFPFLILVCPLIVYLAFVLTNPATIKATHYSYFNYFADALLHRSIAFVHQPQETLDLVLFHDKLYLFAPPSPVLVALPFVWRFGINVPDALYTALVGAINPLLVYLTVLAFARLVKAPLRRIDACLLAIFYAFGTSHFYQSVIGQVWQTGQVITQTYLLAMLLCLFTYLRTPKPWLLPGITLFATASILGRNQLLLGILLLVGLAYLLHRRLWKRVALAVLTGCGIATVLIGVYDVVRFGSLTNNGSSLLVSNGFLTPSIAKYGYFSNHFIVQNVWYHFFNPLLISWRPPYIFLPDYMGNSLFLTSPFLLLLFLIPLWWQRLTHYRWIIGLFLTAALLTHIPALLQHSTGWRQFGARYLLDVMPFFLLVLVLVKPRLTEPVPLALIFASIYIQLHAFLLFRP